MSRLDARYYRDEARKCQEAAARARDRATQDYWLEAERCWFILANQAELVTMLAPSKTFPADGSRSKARLLLS
jgi:hypothetical protein